MFKLQNYTFFSTCKRPEENSLIFRILQRHILTFNGVAPYKKLGTIAELSFQYNQLFKNYNFKSDELLSELLRFRRAVQNIEPKSVE